jgi:hypothetical protein
MFYNILRFYCEDLLATRPAPKPEEHPLSAVREYDIALYEIWFLYAVWS